jgi:hypothetical protein
MSYNVGHVLAYWPRLDIAVRPNGNSGRLTGSSIDRSLAAIDANTIAQLHSR